MTNCVLLLVGLAKDLVEVAGWLPHEARWHAFHEGDPWGETRSGSLSLQETIESFPAIDLVLYVCSDDTNYSTQCHMRFCWVREFLPAASAYRVSVVGTVEDLSFPEFSATQVLNLAELTSTITAHRETATTPRRARSRLPPDAPPDDPVVAARRRHAVSVVVGCVSDVFEVGVTIPGGVPWLALHEKTPTDLSLYSVDIAVFVFSSSTHDSAELHEWIRRAVANSTAHYAVLLPGADPTDLSLTGIEGLRVIELDSVPELLDRGVVVR